MDSIHRGSIVAAFMLSAIGMMLFIACSATHIGRIRNSPEVTRQFENLQVDPDYRYWYLNQENNPFGVVGLDRDYRLNGGPMWQPVAPDSPIFEKVVGLVQDFPLPGSYASGFQITDPTGRVIGVWYSSLPAGIAVDSSTRLVSISTAMPWVFNDDF
jgi:hypothetical protein